MKISFFEKWILRKICRKLVVQSRHHQDNIIEYYRVINEAASNEFTEDNLYTINDFLSECHRDSLKINPYKARELGYLAIKCKRRL